MMKLLANAFERILYSIESIIESNNLRQYATLYYFEHPVISKSNLNFNIFNSDGLS